jgi:hypothetical protein
MPRNGDVFGNYLSANGAPDSAIVVVPSSGKTVVDFALKVIL